MMSIRKTTTGNYALLALILSVTLMFHLPAAIVDLPYIHHADEPTNLSIIHRMMADGTANPKFFNYPSLLFYLNAPGQYLAQLKSDVPIELDIQAMGSVYAPAPEAVILARTTSMLAHLATILSLFLFLLPRAGRALASSAALLAAMSPLTASYSIWAAPDVFAALFVMLCLIASVRIVETGRPSVFIFAGTMAGLAAATKYNAGFVVTSIAVAAALAPGYPFERACLLAGAALVSVLVMLIGSPYLLLDLSSAIQGILFELHHYNTGHIGNEGNALLFNAERIVTGLGAASLLIFPAFWRREMWPVLFFVIGYFLLLSIQTVRFERNLAPLVPAVALLASISALDFIKRAAFTSYHYRTTVLVVSALIAMPAVWMAVRASFPDRTFHSAERVWLENAIPSDANVVVESYTPFVKTKDRNVNAVFFAFVDDWTYFSPSYLVLSMGASKRFYDDPRTRSAFIGWIDELTLEACEVLTYSPGQFWRIKVFKFVCT